MKFKKDMIEKVELQYIINNAGKKVAVVLEIGLYEQMLESLEDAYLGAKSEKVLQEGDFIPFVPRVRKKESK